MRVRIVSRPDGGISVIRAMRERRTDETENAYYADVFEYHMQSAGWDGLPYLDMDDAELPDRRAVCDNAECPCDDHVVRDQWRLTESGIVVDGTVPNLSAISERLVAVRGRLMDALLDEDEPDVAEIFRADAMLARIAEAQRGERDGSDVHRQWNDQLERGRFRTETPQVSGAFRRPRSAGSPG